MTNDQCPDFTSHYENAADILFPNRTDRVTADQDEVILAAAEKEYRECEGH